MRKEERSSKAALPVGRGNDERRWYSGARLAKYYDISLAAVRKFTREGMPCICVGKLKRFDPEQTTAWLNARAE